MKISIITVCLNSSATIGKALNSLKEQDFPSVEHIVKDGKSTDNTLDIVKKDHPDSVIFSSPDNGIYDALNQAMKLATGDIIGILHADDFFYHNRVISNVVNLFQSSGADAVYADLKYVDRFDVNKVIRTWKSGEYKKGDFLYGWMPPHPTFFIRKEVWQKWGNYRLDFNSAADYEWMLRLIHKGGIQLAYLPEFIVCMRVGGKSNASMKNRVRANLEDRRAWKVNGLKPKWYTLYLKPLRKIKQFWG